MQRRATDYRLYVLMASAAAALFAVCFYRILVLDTRLWLIRVQQVTAAAALGVWALAQLADDLRYLLAKKRHRTPPAFWLTTLLPGSALLLLLHASLAIFGQLGGMGRLAYLPSRFLFAVCIGITVLLGILIAVSQPLWQRWAVLATWLQQQRIALALRLLLLLIGIHVWIVGSHIIYLWARALLFAPLLAILTSSVLVYDAVYRRQQWHGRLRLALILIWILGVCGLLNVPSKIIKSYALEHRGHAGKIGQYNHDHN